MQSLFLKHIIENYGIMNGEYVEASFIRKITKQTSITLQELAIGLGLSSCALTKIRKKIPYKVKVTIYSEEEYRKITKQIRKTYRELKKLTNRDIQFLKKSHRLCDKDMIDILQISKREYIKCTKEKQNLIYQSNKCNLTKEEKEILKTYKQKGEISKEDIENLEKTIDEEKIQYELQIPKQEYQKVKKGSKKKISIMAISNKEKKQIQKELYQFLRKKEIMTYEELKQIQERTGYTDFYIRTCLDLSKGKYDTLRKGIIKQYVLLEQSKKRRIDELKIDLKYLAQYGSRDYKKEEIKILCKEYKVEEKLFLMYGAGKPKLYQYYKKAYAKENASLFIGEKRQASNQFIERNFTQLENRINQMVYQFGEVYQCWNEANDLRSIAYLKIVEEGGKYEINFSYDEETAIRVISQMCKYEMLNYLFKIPKELGLVRKVEESEIDMLDFLPDFSYDPQTILMEKEERKWKI